MSLLEIDWNGETKMRTTETQGCQIRSEESSPL